MMTLFIQRANRRDNLALHAKLENFCAWIATPDRSSPTSTSRSLKRLNAIGTKKCVKTPIDLPMRAKLLHICLR